MTQAAQQTPFCRENDVTITSYVPVAQSQIRLSLVCLVRFEIED